MEEVDRDLARAGEELAAAAMAARLAVFNRVFAREAPQPRIADRYRLCEELGRGGQGVVWRAVDESLGREVAIKLVNVARRVSHEWLRREAKLLSRVSHPHVVTVFDVGVCDLPEGADAVFVVMELVRGVPFDVWCARESPRLDRLLALMAQVADGLEALHARGLVHCDVKPANILVVGDVAKLADFGVAHATRSLLDAVTADDRMAAWASTLSNETLTSATRSRQPVGGTPLYMAPEQLTGGRVDARTDEYAFAATLFEAWFKRLPHTADRRAALLEAKLGGAPPCPRTSVGAAAYGVLARSLAADPAQRHGSAATMLDALTRARGRSQQRGKLFALGGLALVLGATVWSIAPADACDDAGVTDDRHTTQLDDVLALGADDIARRRISESIARLGDHAQRTAELRAEICRGDAPDALALRCLARVDTSHRAATSVLDQLRANDPDHVEAVVAELPDPQGCLDGSLETRLGPAALDADDPQTVQAWALLSSARADAAAGRTDAALATLAALPDVAHAEELFDEVELTRAQLLRRSERHDESEVAFRGVYDRATARDASLLAARAARGLAILLGQERGRVDEGLSWIRHAHVQLARTGHANDLEADLASDEAMILFVDGRYRDARPLLAHALELAARQGRSPRVRAELRANFAISLAADGDPSAVDELTAVKAELEAELGPRHPEVIETWANLGNALGRAGRYVEARAHLEHALELRTELYGADAAKNDRLLFLLAELDRVEGDLVSAHARLEQAAALRDRVLPPDDPARAGESLERLELLLQIGDLDRAERLIAITDDRFGSAFAPTHIFNTRLERARGIVAIRRGRLAEGSARIERAVTAARANGSDGEELLQWIAEAAMAEAELGHTDAVREHLALAATIAARPHEEVQASFDELRRGLESQ
ncbi:MAG TPA: serine/threonine-protein kinase [Nannocystaceae bacterium]|nr:serine/threonine-protein kinase [Nannocystaceae bacterium]